MLDLVKICTGERERERDRETNDYQIHNYGLTIYCVFMPKLWSFQVIVWGQGPERAVTMCPCCETTIQNNEALCDHLIVFHKMNRDFATGLAIRRELVKQIVTTRGPLLCMNCSQPVIGEELVDSFSDLTPGTRFIGSTCIWGFGHVADPEVADPEVDTEVNMLVKTQTPWASTNHAQAQPHK